MSNSCKFRIQMGCGEPLQSRWWIAQPVRGLLSPEQGLRAGTAKRRAASRQGAKCKS